MYNSQLIWYKKEDVLNLFDIVERTYFRKLKEMTPDIRTKPFQNKQGKNTTLVHYLDVGKVFERKRTPKNMNNPEVLRNYVGTKQWGLMGNIVPSKSTKREVIEKMKFFQSQVKTMDKEFVLFFNLEKNTADNFYHCHFLMKSKLPKQEIYKFLNLVCEDKIDFVRNIDLKTYDFETYQFRGSMYSDKFGVHNLKNHQEYIHSELMM